MDARYNSIGRKELITFLLRHPKNSLMDKNSHRFLLENAGIAVLPAVALYHNTKIGGRKIRLAFCKKDDTLHEVERRLAKAKLT